MIAAGHPPAEVWRYTPRQMSAFLFLANKRRLRERKESLAIQATAVRADPTELKKLLKADE